MKVTKSLAIAALAVGLAGPAVATTILQYGFDATSGNVAVPVNDDSGSPLHPGSNLIHSGGAPVYSADTPTIGTLPGQAQNVTGIGSVNFAGTNAAISTAASVNAGSGQRIVSAADVYNAGGLTMEVWIKNPSSNSPGSPGAAANFAGMYTLGVNSNQIGFFRGDNSDDLAWSTDQFVAGEWNHLAVTMTTVDPAVMAFTDISSYLNGVEIHSAAHTFPWFLDRAFSVGNHQYGDWTDFEGLVYEPRVSLGVLTPSQFTVVPIPEPAGMTLLALGGMSLMVRRRRPA